MQKLRVLLVEDNEHFIVAFTAVASLSTKYNLDIHPATDFKATVIALKKNIYDLILLDLDVPGLPGGEATVVIIKEVTGNKIPILVVTGGTMTEAELARTGLTRYLPKIDINLARLDEEIELALKPQELKQARLELTDTIQKLKDASTPE